MIPWLLGLFGAIYYLGHSEVRHFENIAARDIKAKIHGENAKVSVRVELNGIIGGPLGDLKKATLRASDFETEGVPLFTEPELSKKGIIRDFRIELREFVLSGLRVQELESDIPDCHFDYGLAVSKKKIRLSASGVGHGEVIIREKDLEAYILRKFKEIKKVSVRVTRGRVLVEGYGEFLIIKANFLVDAKLIPVDGTKLVLSEATILFDGKPADDLAKKTLLDTLNPVVDLNKDLKLYDAVKVDKIVLQDGLIRASGATQIPVKPKLPAPTFCGPSLPISEELVRSPFDRGLTFSYLLQYLEDRAFRQNLLATMSSISPDDHDRLLLFRSDALSYDGGRSLDHRFMIQVA